MDTQKQSQKQPKTLPLTQLSIVTLTEKDMSSVNGGRIGMPGGD
jgi:bacteriocin-like protein